MKIAKMRMLVLGWALVVSLPAWAADLGEGTGKSRCRTINGADIDKAIPRSTPVAKADPQLDEGSRASTPELPSNIRIDNK